MISMICSGDNHSGIYYLKGIGLGLQLGFSLGLGQGLDIVFAPELEVGLWGTVGNYRRAIVGGACVVETISYLLPHQV